MNDIWHISLSGVVLRLLLAAALAGAIGFERGWKQHAAGFRTHILVAIGTASLMLLSIYGFSDLYLDSSNHPADPNAEPNLLADPARLAAQVISGIGFLGAGAILQKKETVIGLTTAASVWIVAVVGLCVGAGFYFCAIVFTALVLAIQIGLSKFESFLMARRKPNKESEAHKA